MEPKESNEEAGWSGEMAVVNEAVFCRGQNQTEAWVAASGALIWWRKKAVLDPSDSNGFASNCSILNKREAG